MDYLIIHPPPLPEFSTCIVVIISFDKIKFTLTQRASFQSIHFRSKSG